MEDPVFAKHNDRDSAARPLAYLPIKLLKQGFDVPLRQAAVYRPGEDQIKGALVLPLHSTMVLLLGTSCGYLSRACWIRITPAITWPQYVISEADGRVEAAQVSSTPIRSCDDG